MLNSDWLSDSIMNGDWLYFSHVKNAIRKADWTYRFFHMWKYSTYRILFARFIASNSRYIYNKFIYEGMIFHIFTFKDTMLTACFVYLSKSACLNFYFSSYDLDLILISVVIFKNARVI